MKLRGFLLLLVLAGVAPAGWAGEPAKPVPTYRISGVALSARDGAPIPFCRVRATPAEDPNQAAGLGADPRSDLRSSRYGGFPQDGRSDSFRSGRGDSRTNLEGAVLADAHGRFSIDVGKAGAWRLAGIARGYRLQGYEVHETFSSAIVLTDAIPAAVVRFQLAPDATVSGTIFDEAGEPVAAAQVVAEQAGTPDVRPAGFAQTDDRGHYEITGLAPGAYRLRAEARPWYASGRGGQPRNFAAPEQAETTSSLDPSLDLVYPVTWFPGTQNQLAADVLTLSGGEDRQADFHLLAQPGARLSVPRPAPSGTSPEIDEESRGESLPFVVRVSNDGVPAPAGTLSATANAWEVGGLAPGTYEVRLPGSAGGAADVRQFTVTAGGTVDLSSAQALVRVQTRFEGDAGERPQVALTDVANGTRYSSGGGRLDSGRQFGRRGEQGEAALSVPAGTYRVSVITGGDTYLAGLTASGAQSDGEIVKIADGTPVLTLKMAAGRAQVAGVAHRGTTPSAGAMVLLVPALAEASGLADRIVRTETNSDGSFTLASLVPGPYILVVLDNGWSVNWRDEQTLAPYLLHGIPVDLKPAARQKVDVTAVTP